jgi:hypothetical protein
MSDEELKKYEKREGMRRAAQRVIAMTNASHDVEQVHEIRFREADAYAEDDGRVVVVVPIGPILGIAIVNEHDPVKDADLVFISAQALALALPALGFHGYAGPGVGVFAGRWPDPSAEGAEE